MKRLAVFAFVFVVLVVPFGNTPVFRSHSGANIGGSSFAEGRVLDGAVVENFWSKYETEYFVDTFVYPIFRDPGYYPGSDVKMGTFAILMGCTGNCAEWISHVVEVDNITPEYMCAWLYEYGVKRDYGRHRTVSGEVVEATSREEFMRSLDDILGTDKKPNCQQFLTD